MEMVRPFPWKEVLFDSSPAPPEDVSLILYSRIRLENRDEPRRILDGRRAAFVPVDPRSSGRDPEAGLTGIARPLTNPAPLGLPRPLRVFSLRPDPGSSRKRRNARSTLEDGKESRGRAPHAWIGFSRPRLFPERGTTAYPTHGSGQRGPEDTRFTKSSVRGADSRSFR
jgi:hypothetical protein